MASTDNVESVKAGINVANLFHRITPMGQHENNFLVYCAREQINLTDKSVRDGVRDGKTTTTNLIFISSAGG